MDKLADIPPDPGDPEWEDWAEERLETVDFDSELGKQLGKDAQRLVAGDLSPEDFHDRYHDAVVDEFGVDHRGDISPADVAEESTDTPPATTNGDGGDPGEPLPGVPGGDDPSRRSVLKTAGVVGAAAVGLGASEQFIRGVYSDDGTADDDTPEADEDIQYGMAINQNNCIACLNCIEACNEENNNTPDALWMFVHRYVEDNYVDDEEYLPRPCQHCSDAPCTAACPVASRYTRDEDGIVMTDYDACVGCRYCEVACPYGVNYLQWDEPRDVEGFKSSGIPIEEVASEESDIALDSESGSDIKLDGEQEVRYDTETADGKHAAGRPPQGVMGKCTFCVHRQDSEHEELVGTTACEDICPTDAIQFGNLNDPESAPRQHLEELDDTESTYRLLEEHGTEPNIIYVGSQPSPDATPVAGPRTVEDMNRDLQRNRAYRDDVEYPEEDD